ncbi:energy transducer TonB [Prosthecobacter vanneervenii]|uniref:Outer membrane biosynthesis protein TonB n=1 Tax=Prosthecobacter vanneervenii TaxID=48466 RepID=A0A7W7YFV8_9BACT|nr:hypothetical protein [Prosthecobacter vanneervenii]MBB5035440.1 outer membrane biosynthesis protein TonB [Prosthecobacter vanneervenii]
MTALSQPDNFNNSSNNNLRIAITGTIVVHALLFVLLAWLFAQESAHKLWKQAHQPPKEKEVTLIFPEQLMPPPEPVKPKPPPPPTPPPRKPEVYMRTSQNQEADSAPKNPSFIADRNTKASTRMAPPPDGTEPLPTMNGLKIPTRELADRDHHDGDLKDDARPKSPERSIPMLQPQPPQPPAPEAPRTEMKPQQTASQFQPAKPAPQQIAKAKPDDTPLTKMMEEADKELAKVDKNLLPIEVKKPDAMQKKPDAPPTTDPKAEPAPTPKPEMAQQSPPESMPQKPVPKALPVLDDEVITRTTPNQAPNSFTPFTRRSQTKGTISTRGTEDSVDAEATPKGRYIRQVTGQVEKKWHVYRLLRRDGVTYGSLQVVFFVNKQGKVEDLRIVNDKDSNPILTGFTLQAIRDADIPPMPADVIPSLPMNDQERLKVEYNVLIY